MPSSKHPTKSEVETAIFSGAALRSRFEFNSDFPQFLERVTELKEWQSGNRKLFGQLLVQGSWEVAEHAFHLPASVQHNNFRMFLPDILKDLDVHLSYLRQAVDEFQIERDVFSRERRDALIMKGGGVKGIALAGAIRQLECCYEFDTYVGTSAGSIAAVLLAAGYTGSELETLLYEKDFSDFLDAKRRNYLGNIVVRGGIHHGDNVKSWVAELLKQKLGSSQTNMKQLPRRAVLFATTPGEDPLVFDSYGSHSETPVDFAVRCSMSIPFFFQDVRFNGKRVYDGGLGHNFPVKSFLEVERKRNAGEPTFLGLYLGSEKQASISSRPQIAEILDILLGRDEAMVVDQNRDHILVIDTSPVGTVDFKLSQQEKDFLVYTGRAAAADFLRRNEASGAPDVDEIHRIASKREELRRKVYQHRKRQLP